MLVRKWMTPELLTISPETPVLDAIRLLKERGFRRLPVVDRGKLVGIVTDKDLKDAMPSKVTTLSIWELNYLLAKLTVTEVMAKPVVTISENAGLEEAALLLEEYKVGGLPVMRDNVLVGIITITDVLRAFVEAMGLNEGGVRITVDVDDQPGALVRAANAAKPSNILSLITAGRHEGKRRLVFRVSGEDAAGLAERLKAAGEDVVEVRVAAGRTID